MENLSNNSNKDNYWGLKLALFWLFISLIFTSLILDSLFIPQIPLYDSSCGLSTILECNTDAIKKAREEVRKNLPTGLERLAATREAVPLLKLFSASYRLLIVDMGSESQFRISNPPKIFSTGEIDLLCVVSSKQIILKNRRQIELATATFTDNIQKDVNNIITLLDKFQGCTFLPREQKQELNFPPGTIAAPEARLSWVMLIKPSLEFEVDWKIKIFLFAGVFALVGAFLALLKQFLNVARKGMSYLFDD